VVFRGGFSGGLFGSVVAGFFSGGFGWFRGLVQWCWWVVRLECRWL